MLHISLQHLGHDVVHIVIDDTAPKFLATQTTFAELDDLTNERNLLHIVSGSLGSFNKLVGEHVAVHETLVSSSPLIINYERRSQPAYPRESCSWVRPYLRVQYSRHRRGRSARLQE